jgi:PAS domain S-box-containing protein
MSAPDLWAAGALPRALFEQSPFSTVVYDAEGRPLAVNAAFTALWGGVTLDAVPAGYSVLADAQLEEQGTLPLVRRAFAGERVVTPPIRFDMARVATTGAGRTVWTQGHFYPVRDADGRLTHVVLVHTDITERMHAERAIREGEERLRLAQQVAHTGTFDWHVPSGRVAWTEEEERIFGLAAGTFEGTIDAWLRRVLPEDAAGMQAAMADAMARGVRDMDFTFRIRRPDGEVRHIEGRGAFLYAADGTPERMVGVNLDVTDRRRAEEELARGERALREAVDRTTRLQAVTAAFARALTAAEIAGVTLDEGLAALGAQAAVVFLASADGRTLTAAASRGVAEDVLRPWATLDVDAPVLVAEAVRVGAPLYAPDREARLARYPAARAASARVPQESWAAIPLLIDGRRLGALALGFAAPRAFGPAERAFAEVVAQQCAQALERARLYEAERDARRAAEASARRLAALQAATAELTAALTPREVVDAVLRAGLPAVGATRGSVALLTDDGAAVEVAGAAGYPEEFLASYRRVPIDAAFPLTDAVRTGESLYLPTAEARAERYPHLEALRRDRKSVE